MSSLWKSVESHNLEHLYYNPQFWTPHPCALIYHWVKRRKPTCMLAWFCHISSCVPWSAVSAGAPVCEVGAIWTPLGCHQVAFPAHQAATSSQVGSSLTAHGFRELCAVRLWFVRMSYCTDASHFDWLLCWERGGIRRKRARNHCMVILIGTSLNYCIILHESTESVYSILQHYVLIVAAGKARSQGKQRAGGGRWPTQLGCCDISTANYKLRGPSLTHTCLCYHGDRWHGNYFQLVLSH